MSIPANCSTVTTMSIPAKCSMSKHKTYFNQIAMELMAEDFGLPSGVLEFKAGWTLALATSMTFTTLVPDDGSWSEEGFLIFNCSDKVCFNLCQEFCLLKHVNIFKQYVVEQLCLALCYYSANCFSLRLVVKKFTCNRRFWNTPYQCEYQQVWKTQDSSDGKPDLYICGRVLRLLAPFGQCGQETGAWMLRLLGLVLRRFAFLMVMYPYQH